MVCPHDRFVAETNDGDMDQESPTLNETIQAYSDELTYERDWNASLFNMLFLLLFSLFLKIALYRESRIERTLHTVLARQMHRGRSDGCPGQT